MTPPSGQALLLTTDLIFETKIRSTGQAVGMAVTTVRSTDQLREALDASNPAVVLIDLDAFAERVEPIVALALAHKLKPRVVAYGSHVEAALLQRASDAGAHQVMPRSRFSVELPRLLQSCMPGSQSAASEE